MNKKIFVMMLILILVTIGFSGCLEDEETAAYEASKNFVRSCLKAPSTAKFAPIGEATIEKKGDNGWAILSYVDAQNAFGAYIRNYYACRLEKKNSGYKLIALNLDEDIAMAPYKWVEEKYFIGSDDRKTDDFKIVGDWWKIEWEVGGRESYEDIYSDLFSFSVNVINSDTNTSVDWIYTGDPYDSGIRYIEGSGTFYLDISTINVDDWTITVYQGINILL